MKKRFWADAARRVGAMKGSRGMKQNVHRELFIPGRGGPNRERRPGTQLFKKIVLGPSCVSFDGRSRS